MFIFVLLGGKFKGTNCKRMGSSAGFKGTIILSTMLYNKYIYLPTKAHKMKHGKIKHTMKLKQFKSKVILKYH